MKVGVFGLWHLGCVTAACLSSVGHDVIGYDPSIENIIKLQSGEPPLFEPGLAELIAQGIKNNKLKFSSNFSELSQVEIAWITFDTPVDENDNADVDYVKNQIISIFPFLANNALLLVSSQLPVGTMKVLREEFKKKNPSSNLDFAYSPENLRLGKAIDIFLHPDRVVIGCDAEKEKIRFQQLFKNITNNIIWMSVASAEMTKHALNAFLATSVVFINELAVLCEKVGANASEVELGLKSEARIGPKAYLHPGGAFAGGTLARDVTFLQNISDEKLVPTKLFSAILESNQIHKQWAFRRIIDSLGDIKGKTIAVLGLTYKPETNTLRRSESIETCRLLSNSGANVSAFDPALKELPLEYQNFISLKLSIKEAIANADAVIISTPWPEFLKIEADDFVKYMNKPLIFDVNGFLNKIFNNDNRIKYYFVGKGV
ncbi:MAG: hypothetical protein A2X12_02175 [Bacteroidetes bacterium GWE2_29_8]|nr:MAG: hypothetical protein A2X12_02175 [Bacteroidetes bacterium GWE2_29_8]